MTIKKKKGCCCCTSLRRKNSKNEGECNGHGEKHQGKYGQGD
jgi:hypothetical protein